VKPDPASEPMECPKYMSALVSLSPSNRSRKIDHTNNEHNVHQDKMTSSRKDPKSCVSTSDYLGPHDGIRRSAFPPFGRDSLLALIINQNDDNDNQNTDLMQPTSSAS